MVKQLKINGDIKKIIDEGMSYYNWLEKLSGVTGKLPRILADTEFISMGDMDETLIKSAREDLRESYSEECGKKFDLDSKAVETIRKNIRGECCLLEIVVYLAKSINDMVTLSDEDDTPKFARVMLSNAGMMDDAGISDAYWKTCAETLMNRMYSEDGTDGGLFPVRGSTEDKREQCLWKQMNDWVDAHTNEEGEWID